MVSGWLTRISWAGGTFPCSLAVCLNPAFHGGGGRISPPCSKGEGRLLSSGHDLAGRLFLFCFFFIAWEMHVSSPNRLQPIHIPMRAPSPIAGAGGQAAATHCPEVLPGVVTTAAMGKPFPIPLAMVTMSGRTPWVWKPQK